MPGKFVFTSGKSKTKKKDVLSHNKILAESDDSNKKQTIMKALTVLISLLISGIGLAQENDSIAIMRYRADSLLNRLDLIVGTFPESSVIKETRNSITKADKTIDSLYTIIHRICKRNSNNRICLATTIVSTSFDTIDYKLDRYFWGIKDKDDYSFYAWTENDSIYICDLERSMVNVKNHLCSGPSFFNDSTRLMIENILGTNAGSYDVRSRFSNGVFTIGTIKLHILTLSRNLKKLQVKLLASLVADVS